MAAFGAHNPLLPGGDQSLSRPFGFVSQPFMKTKPVAEPSTRTQQPIVTGTGVLGIKYNGGVMLACDTLGEFGNMD
eukprot:753612-Hanusia_phi.AAC.1